VVRVEEHNALTAVLDADYDALYRFYILSGLRLREALLRKDQIDFVLHTIEVRRKGGKIVTLPITPAMESVLLECWDDHPEWVLTYVAERTRDGRKKGERYPITASGWKTYWRRRRAEAVKAGCTSLISTDRKTNLRIHDLRHTFGTNLQMATGDVRLTQRGLAHSKVETTEKYTHVFDDKLYLGMTTAEKKHYLPGLARKST